MRSVSKQVERRAPDHAECAIDLVHLSRQTLGDAALEAELLRLFDLQAGGFMARLQAETSPEDGAKRADLAHMLKGSARAVGAFALADAMERFEYASRRGGVEAPALLQEVERAIAQARADLARLL